MMVMLDPSQPPLLESELHRRAWERHGVHLSLMHGVRDMMTTALNLSPMPLEEALSKFPRAMLVRLQELEASEDGITAWAAHFQGNE
jgi:hypothetical protein